MNYSCLSDLKKMTIAITLYLGLSVILYSQESTESKVQDPTVVDIQGMLDSINRKYAQKNSSYNESITEFIADSTIVYPNFNAPEYEIEKERYQVSEVPSPRGKGLIGSVSDPMDYITDHDEQLINKMLYALEQKTTAEIAVVILPSIGSEVPKDFAVELFSTWGIGKSDTDNGLLILTVMDQRRTEFEVGYGLEPILTDIICYRIGMNEIVPEFQGQNYGAGLVKAVYRVRQFLEEPEAIPEIYSHNVTYIDEDSEGHVWFFWVLAIYGIICALLGLWYFGVAFDIKRSKDDYYDKYHRLHKLKFGCVQYLFPLPMLLFAKIVEKRLIHYRNAPRFSKKNGLPMTMLTNYDEIDYLEEAQLVEEDIRTILYDVWVTEDKSDVMILEYDGPNGRNYSNCKECGYKTFGKITSLILVAATYDRGGTRIDKYECRNCNYMEEKEIETPQKSRPSDSSSSSSSFSSSSSSSSSSSFGGGSSGGGGAGVSW